MIAATPIRRRLLSDAVHDRLLGEILAGSLAPGEPLPSERSLSESLNVNRHAVREALKRLQQAGLVTISQGGATRVNDWRRSAGLDLLVAIAKTGAPGPDFLLDVVEMRRAIGVDVARRAATRSGGETREQIRLWSGKPPAERTSELDRADAYRSFWNDLVVASGSLPYRLAYNSLIQAQEVHAEALASLTLPELSDARQQRELARAVFQGDAVRAERAARRLLDLAVEAASAL